MAKFDDFLAGIKDGSKVLAKEVFAGFEAQAREDASAFLEKAQDDLRRWTLLLAEGSLTEQDFSDLVQAKKALAEMHALRQTGVALTKVERFRSGFITLVIDTAFNVFL